MALGRGSAWVALLLLAGAYWVSARAAADAKDVKVGDAIYLRSKLTGACLTVQGFNGEDHHTVHAQYLHHGLWQQLTVLKEDSAEGDAVVSGGSILLRGHNSKCLEIFNTRVVALRACQASQALEITKDGGAPSDPIRTGDVVFLKAAANKRFLGIMGTEVEASEAAAGPEQAFIVDARLNGSFDGRWTEESAPGEDVFVIQGDALHFVDDIEFGVFPQGGGKFTTGLTGQESHSAGELKDGKIYWTNGDVWIRTEGPFDGRWTAKDSPGGKVFHITGNTLQVLGGATSTLTLLSDTKFTTTEGEAPDSHAELAGSTLLWGNGSVWVLMAAGRFDGRWTSKADHGGDYFDIEGDMLFFDAGLETKIVPTGNSFTTMLKGDGSHVTATLDANRTPRELRWNNGDVWVYFHDAQRDFWLPPTTTAGNVTGQLVVEQFLLPSDGEAWTTSRAMDGSRRPVAVPHGGLAAVMLATLALARLSPSWGHARSPLPWHRPLATEEELP